MASCCCCCCRRCRLLLPSRIRSFSGSVPLPTGVQLCCRGEHCPFLTRRAVHFKKYSSRCSEICKLFIKNRLSDACAKTQNLVNFLEYLARYFHNSCNILAEIPTSDCTLHLDNTESSLVSIS